MTVVRFITAVATIDEILFFFLLYTMAAALAFVCCVVVSARLLLLHYFCFFITCPLDISFSSVITVLISKLLA